MSEYKERCDVCKFVHDSDTEPGMGLCRRYPPVMYNQLSATETHYAWKYPVVDEDGWCGEFVPDEYRIKMLDEFRKRDEQRRKSDPGYVNVSVEKFAVCSSFESMKLEGRDTGVCKNCGFFLIDHRQEQK